ESRTAKATSRTSAPFSLPHKAGGSTYHRTNASKTAPAATRTTTRQGRRVAPRAGGAVSDGSPVGAVRGRPPARTGCRAQHILRPPWRLVVDRGEQLAQHAGGHQLHTDQRQQHAKQQQRTPADRMSEDELVHAEIGQDQQSETEQRE